MSKRPYPTYQIVVQEQLDESWETWFENVHITQLSSGSTLVRCTQIDQVRLFTILNKIRDLNLTLSSVTQIEGQGQYHETYH